MIKKLRLAKQYGTWYYKKTAPDIYNELDAPLYTLYNSEHEFVCDFGGYDDMITYCMTGEILA